ncbi:MAG: Inner membrane transport permease YadH [Alphaproteobacteria bacterium MarineAlpha9_Bin4]|nr:MAG: Inner membrane transport permease YadH [Alphaproteobacteria bacterium MarineAlpha9_Bin4]
MIGSITLFNKEVKRFLKVYQQTIVAPAFTSLLFLLVIDVAIADRTSYKFNYIDFLGPGLIIMGMMQNAFANTSSSLLSSKVAGNIVDLLMPPFNVNEIILIYCLAAMIRAILVGVLTFVIMFPFVNFEILNIYNLLLYSFLGSLLLALVGLIAGIWAEKFDNMSAITNFIITPLTFLSGTFYSIDKLKEPFYSISLYNPFYYIIDGFRSSFIFTGSYNIIEGIFYLITLNVILYLACYFILKSGWKLKS